MRDDFSILPEAIRDGQRIVAAMAATLTVLLARTFYVLLIIVGAALLHCRSRSPHARTGFRLRDRRRPDPRPRPWVRPGPSRSGILAQTLRISIPLSLGVAAVGLPVYVTALANGASTDAARTMLTTIACFLGIGALVLIPIAADAEGRIRMPAEVRTAILVAVLVAAYLAVLATEPGRAFFQLAPLPWEIVASLIAIAIAWTAAVIGIHKTRGRPARDRRADRPRSVHARTAARRRGVGGRGSSLAVPIGSGPGPMTRGPGATYDRANLGRRPARIVETSCPPAPPPGRRSLSSGRCSPPCSSSRVPCRSGRLDSPTAFATHRDFGYTIGLLTLVLVIISVVGRLPRRLIGLSALTLLQFFLQSILIGVRADLPTVAALHPVNGVPALVVTLWLGREAWAGRAATS